MTVIMDERMHEDIGYLSHHLDQNSPFNGVIVTDFARRIEDLKPHANKILEAIALTWKTLRL